MIDLVTPDPASAGLGPSAREIDELRRAEAPAADPGRARAAVVRYLEPRAAVPPGQVFLAASPDQAYAAILRLLVEPGDEVLVPAPSAPLFGLPADLEGALGLRRYPLIYDGGWRLKRRALARAVTARTRAVVVASPAIPTGGLLAPEDLAFLEELCAERGLALVGDERYADTATAPAPSVASVKACLGFHLATLAAVSGASTLAVAWVAAVGPAELLAPSLERLEAATAALAGGEEWCLLPALLEGRRRFQDPLRARLRENRALLARASLGEAPFTLLNAGGGWFGVLEIGPAEEEAEVARALAEEGVRVLQGSRYGFEHPGYLVVSLLPSPELVREGAERIARGLRRPLAG